MSFVSEQSSQPLMTSVFLDSHSSHTALSKALLELSQCKAIYNGNVNVATGIIAHSIVKNLGATNCHIWLYEEEQTTLQQVAQYGTNPPNKQKISLQTANHADYDCLLSQRDWLIINTRSSLSIATSGPSGDYSEVIPPYLDNPPQHPITALIEVPIRQHGGQIAGVLCCDQRYSPRVWQAAEQSFMITAASFLGLVVSQSIRQQQAKTLARQKRQLTLEMIERQQAEQAWQESQQFIQGILDASTNILYVNAFVSGENSYVNGYMSKILGYSPEEIRKFGPRFLEQIAHIEDIEKIHQARQKLAQSNLGDIVETEYRLRHKQNTWHWMLCRETIFQWDPDGTPIQLLGTATDITARKKNTDALAQRNHELTVLTTVDSLTQVANRRAFDAFLTEAWATRFHTPLTLILCDVDYFKLYNDTYGHQAGDDCLHRVAQSIRQTVKRHPDLVARYGGEEFAIVLPNTARLGAQRVADNIQVAIRRLKIEHRLSTVSRYLTMSLGIATIESTTESSPQELIAAADRGLYKAKYDGRARSSVGHME